MLAALRSKRWQNSGCRRSAKDLASLTQEPNAPKARGHLERENQLEAEPSFEAVGQRPAARCAPGRVLLWSRLTAPWERMHV